MTCRCYRRHRRWRGATPERGTLAADRRYAAVLDGQNRSLEFAMLRTEPGGRRSRSGADRRSSRCCSGAGPSRPPTRRRRRAVLPVFALGLPSFVIDRGVFVGLLRARGYEDPDALRVHQPVREHGGLDSSVLLVPANSAYFLILWHLPSQPLCADGSTRGCCGARSSSQGISPSTSAWCGRSQPFSPPEW